MNTKTIKKAKDTSPYTKDFYAKSADLFKVMSNAKRLEILNLIKDREVTVNELSTILGTRKSNTSQHLAYLRYVGLVIARRQGKNIFYKLVDPRIVEPCKIFLEISKKKATKPSSII
jgi:DNA-binding transcriptional ArsR family regulator